MKHLLRWLLVVIAVVVLYNLGPRLYAALRIEWLLPGLFLMLIIGLISFMSGRQRIFVYDLVIACLLALLAVCYFKGPTLSVLLPEDLQGTPIYSVWFGALGGLAISFKGVYDHVEGTPPPVGWDDRYALWHMGRPISGAITGGMTYLLLLALNASEQPTTSIVYAAAFILGTQEARFFAWLYEIARVIVHVPQPPLVGLQVTGVRPEEGPANSVVIVSGQGFVPQTTVTFQHDAWRDTLQHVQVSADGTAVAGLVPAGGPGGTRVNIEVTNPGGTTVVLPNAFMYQ